MGGESQSTQQTNSSQSFPDWTQGAGQNIFQNAQNWFSQNPSMPLYQGQRVAEFGPDFTQAENSISGMLTDPNDSYNTASSKLTQMLGGLDPNKSVQDYMSPYTSAVLDPTLRNIREQGDLQQAQDASGAAMSGAFGDTGYALQRALTGQKIQQNVGDATAKGYDQAFQNAQQARNQTLQQIMQGSQALSGLNQSETSRRSGLAQMLAGMGASRQQAQQGGINSQMEEFARASGYPLRTAQQLATILRTLPLNQSGSSSTTSTQPDNSGLGLVGSLLGAFL